MARTPKESGRETAPQQFAEVPPPKYAQPGHDFTLQCIMELQKSVGVLSTKVDRLIDDVNTQHNDISGIKTKITLFLGGAAVVGVMAGIMGTVALQVPWSRLFVAPAAVSAPAVQRNVSPAPAPAAERKQQ